MKIITLTSLDSSELDVYARLTESQLRNRLEPEKGVFIAESLKVVRIALSCGYRPLSFLAERRLVESQLMPLEGEIGDVPVYTGDRELLASLTGYELTRGILSAMWRPPLPSVTEVCDGKRRIAVLDGVVNSTNTGAIFRAATALGVEGILLTPTCCDPFNRRSLRVSMGTVLQMPWTYLNSGDCRLWCEELRRHGFATVALALNDKALRIDDPLLCSRERLAIVLGTEGDGLSDVTIRACDYTAIIPMQRGVDSLNVAAAAAVAFWELRTEN